jgi:Asp/Glu/hydantoin racemase
MTDSSQLLVCPDRLDRLVQLLLRRMQMLFRLRAMPSHIVMVGCAGLVHLMDCLSHVFLDPLQIVPVMNPIGDRDPGSKRQAHRKNGN